MTQFLDGELGEAINRDPTIPVNLQELVILLDGLSKEQAIECAYTLANSWALDKPDHYYTRRLNAIAAILQAYIPAHVIKANLDILKRNNEDLVRAALLLSMQR